MLRKYNNITSLLLLLVFLFPSIVRLDHHHEQFKCDAKNEKHYHISHEKCGICNFEFSVFSSVNIDNELQRQPPSDRYCNNYSSVYFSPHTQFSYLLRAPPLKQI
jgi:hypothetical protein